MALVRPTQGVNFTPVPPTNLDIHDMGQVALTGDFDSISLYTYQQQTENAFSTNGTQSIITQLPNGDFATSVSADGYIRAMCPFVMRDGTLSGIIIGGNFTSLGGVEAQGVAMYDSNSGKVTPLPGLTGSVIALLCDKDTSTVYVGGEFKGANSTNAVAWVGGSGWATLPFQGFNGPVNSIIAASDGNIIYGGSFTGLGNTTDTTPNQKDQQIINISSANITAVGTTDTDGFNNASNIVCKTNGQDGPGNTWLLEDDSPGSWTASMAFGYEPSLLRIWNTHQDGRGTKTFRFTAIPLNGIMNFTYTDPDSGQENQYCDARCPLSANKNVPYQDFHFWNTVGMNAFRIDISEWYGEGGGLDGIELFQNDMFAYAVNDLNEPACANIPLGSNSISTGHWTVTPSNVSNSEYLTATLNSSSSNSSEVSVIFQPDIKQQANYTVTIFTPGCQQDNTCNSRGIVNVTGNYSSSGLPVQPISLYQTNDYDKYDTIYTGPVDINSDGFRPSVTLRPASNQKDGTTIVAQRVQFIIGDSNSTGSLNGLYEFNPNAKTLDTNFSSSSIDQAGVDLSQKAIITSIVALDNITYIGGNFSDNSTGFQNIFSIGPGNATSLPNGGLNAEVMTMISYGELLYVGGNFTNTMNGSITGLNNVAAYNTTSRQWQPLGAGASATVYSIVTLEVNVTTDNPETCVTINGFFDQLNGFGPNKDVSVSGFGIWVPSRQNWLQNLHLQSQAINGQLSTMTNVTGGGPLLAGTLSSQDIMAHDAVSLTDNPTAISPLNAGIQPQRAGPPTRKRALSERNVTGVVTGLFHGQSPNVTILGGHFAATASNGSSIDNLVFLNNTGTPTISGLASGLDTDSSFLALATSNSVLYAGGTVTGKVHDGDVNGLITYDLDSADYTFPQPPAFAGDNVAVNAIAVRPKKDQVYVGGSFASAGSLPCPGVCVFENGAWNQPGSGLGGNVLALAWQGTDTLLAGGNLTVNNNATSLARYDTSKSQWTVLDGAAENIPGPVTALALANDPGSQFWVAGKSGNGSAFLIKYDGNYHSIGDGLGTQTTILGLSVLQLHKTHNDNDLVPNNMILLVTGQLNLPSFGNVSAALFNGTTFSPFILSTSGNSPGSISQLFSEKQVQLKAAGGHMAIGFVVLISLACALGAIFLLVLAGIIIERYRRKHEGYSPAPTTYFDKTSNMGRIPPEHLFGRLGQSRPPML
ncbi:hypothetical protein ACLMJK_006884 [Lecanora helva]